MADIERSKLETDDSSEPPSHVVDKVARAIWESQRKSEIEKISDFTFDHSLFVRTAEIFQDASSREVVLLGFSLISECLNASVRYHLSHSTKRDQSDLLDGLGPLSSDAAKLKLVRVMGWLPIIISDGVEAFRKTRNIVAHQIKLNDEIKILSKIPSPTRKHLDETITRVVSVVIDLADRDGLKIERVQNSYDLRAYALFLALFTLEAVVCGPGSLRLGLGDQVEGFYSFDEAPPWAAEARRSCAKAFLMTLKQFSLIAATPP